MATKVEEKIIKGLPGGLALVIYIVLVAAAIFLIAAGIAGEADGLTAMAVAGALLAVLLIIGLNGFKVLAPNEAAVLTFFGKYYGTLKRDGFYYVNPLCATVNPAAGLGMLRKKVSLKAMTLNNEKQKVNDEEGNPIEIGVVVIWRVVDTAKAVFAVENYSSYIATQTDSAIRQVARQYPYDVSDSGDEKSLRGSSQEIAMRGLPAGQHGRGPVRLSGGPQAAGGRRFDGGYGAEKACRQPRMRAGRRKKGADGI